MSLKPLEPLFWRFALAIAIAAGGWSLATPVVEAQGGITVNIPEVLAAGPDYATDVIGDAWDMSNGGDVAVDPAQRTGWSSLGFSGGRLDGITAAVGGTVNGSNVSILQRAY